MPVTTEIPLGPLTVRVTRKRMKTLRMRVPGPEPVVFVSAPYGTNDDVIRGFVTERSNWIERQRAAHRSRASQADRLETGGALRLWGTWVAVERLDGTPARAQILGDRVVVRAPDDATAERAVARLRAREVNQAALPIVSRYVPRMAVPEPTTIRYRQMRTRWGSCNHATRAITLNTLLARYPEAALEYVVVHELAHLNHPNHSPEFWALVASTLPDHELRRRLLRSDGGFMPSVL